MQFSPKGIYTAIVTPFTAADEFDEPAFRRLIDFQVDEGAAGLLVIGGSGEFVSLTPSERQRAIDVAIDQAARRIPIIVGALGGALHRQPPGPAEGRDGAHRTSGRSGPCSAATGERGESETCQGRAAKAGRAVVWLSSVFVPTAP